MQPSRLCVLIPLVSLAASVSAVPDLRIGDPAPDMDIAHWVKTPGGVSAITPGDGNVYVLDFWATWCAPCIGGFPAMSELQEEYADRGVVVIGVSDEPLATVEAFLRTRVDEDRTQSDRMRFVVATDPDLSTRTGVLEASSRYVLPQGMIIGRDGVIEWVGHPKTGKIEDVLAAYLAGDWDRAAYRETFEAELAAGMSDADRLEAALENEDWAGAEALAGDDWEQVNAIAWRLVLNPGGAIEDRDLAARRAAGPARDGPRRERELPAPRARRGAVRARRCARGGGLPGGGVGA